jgi:hypothetical protein
METIVITRTFDGELDEMVDYARSLNSRLNWPGAVLEFERPGALLGYNVGMRLKAATMTDITIEETLSDVERSDSGEVLFSTVNKGLWPDGHMTVLAEWRFIPGDEGDPNTLRYTYSYPPPSSKLVKPKQLPAFNVAMEKVCNRFIKGVLAHGGSPELAAAKPVAPEHLSVAEPTGSVPFEGARAPAPDAAAYQVAGMDTVVATATFSGDLDAMVEFTRSLKSRLNWPGAVLEGEVPGALTYQVGMRIQAAVMTDVNVTERLGPVDRLDDGAVRFTTVHRVLWPDGLQADAITEYLFVPGAGGAPHTLRFSYSYPPPSTKLVRTKELPAFHAAMEKVSARYVDKLAKAV